MDLKSLYHIYNADQLVLIVGSEVLRMQDMPRPHVNGDPQRLVNKTFEEAAIERITDRSNLSSPKTFSGIAIEQPDKGLSSNEVIGVYRSFRDRDFDKSLVKSIANLSKVSLVIQTSFDPVLKDALGNNIDTYVWSKESKAPIHFDLTNGKRKLFYLFGDMEKGIALFEEEQVDCLLNLSASNEINKKNAPSEYSFLEYLNNKTLVFIGNNFSDWFMRLMIRTLYNRPIPSEAGKAYIINDSEGGIKYQRYFFDKFKIQLIHEYPIEDFLESFQQIIDEHGSFNNYYDGMRVFISYDRHDRECALLIKKALNIKHIEVFLDTSDIGLGEHDKQITAAILSNETCFFVAVVSQFMVERPKADSYAKRVEWSKASDRYTINKYLAATPDKSDPTPFVIVPTAVDDFRPYLDRLPNFITENTIWPCDPKQLADFIEVEIKRLRHG